MNRISLYKAMAALVAVFACVSCQKDNGLETTLGDGSMMIAVESKGAPAVKGGVSGTPIVLEGPDTTLTMWMSSSPMKDVNDGLTVGNYVTKGERITSANITEKRNGNIMMTVYSADTAYIAPSALTFDRWKEENLVSYWKFSDGNGRLWPKTDAKFFAWSPSSITAPSLDPSTGIMTLDYTLPDDAADQPDIIFAGESFAQAPGDNTVNLKFEHMLSALHFEIGKTNDMTVKEIKFEKMFSKGKLTYNPATGTTAWSGLDEQKDFTQEYTAEEGDIHEDLAYKIDCGRDPQLIGKDDKTFMVIPQTSGKNDKGEEVNKIILSITFSLKGSSEDIIYSKVLTDDDASWQPGMEYRYTLNITNGLDIEIEDEVAEDGKVKQNLDITNVGGKPAYVRVLVTGNWVNADGDIVALWDPTDTNMGTFEPAIFSGASYSTGDWARGTDGFFYYRHVLPPGEPIPAAKQLFDTYTAKEAGMPKSLKAGDHLEIDVVAQAVVAEDKNAITAAWGTEAAGFVE